LPSPIRARETAEDVVSVATGERVRSRITNQRVVELGPADVFDAVVGVVLGYATTDPGRQIDGHGSEWRIPAVVDGIVAVPTVQDIGAIGCARPAAVASYEGVVAGATLKGVVAGSTDQHVGTGVTRQRVVELGAGDVLDAVVGVVLGLATTDPGRQIDGHGRECRFPAVVDSIIAVPTVEGIGAIGCAGPGAAASDEGVVAGATLHGVIAVSPNQQVRSRITNQRVVEYGAGDVLDAVVCVALSLAATDPGRKIDGHGSECRFKYVVDGVDAVPAVEGIGTIGCAGPAAAASDEAVGAVATLQDVVAGATLQGVVAGSAVQHVGTGITRQRVVECAAGDVLDADESVSRGVSPRCSTGAEVDRYPDIGIDIAGRIGAVAAV